MGMRKFFRWVHLWLSVPFGVCISLVCFSGAMLVFEEEVTRLCRPALYEVDEVKEETLPLDELVARAAPFVPEGVRVAGITSFADPARAWQVNLSRPKRAALAIDPYTGEVKGRHERLPFFTVMFRLHRWMLDASRPSEGVWWGKMVVGASTLMFVAALLSGIGVWWPRTRKAFSDSLKVVARKGWRRFWHSLHVAGGMYAVLLLLVMALTGLTWSFGWYRTAFYRAFGVELAKAASRGGTGGGQVAGTLLPDVRNWQKVHAELSGRNPGWRQIMVADGQASVAFDALGNRRAADRYRFSPSDGQVTQVSLYKDAAREGKLRGWIYSLHVGNWGGWVTRILYFAAALLGAALPLTGYYLWIARLLRKGRRRAALP